MNGLDLNNINSLPLGFLIVILSMVIVVAVLFLFFKKKQWILVKKDSDDDDDELLINKELRKGKNSSNMNADAIKFVQTNKEQQESLIKSPP